MRTRTREFPPLRPPARRERRRRPRILATSAAALIASVFLGSVSHLSAVTPTWSMTPTDGNWITTTENNWSTGSGTFPGSLSGTTNSVVATFNSPSSQTTITLGSNLNIGGITFDTNAAAYTISPSAGASFILTNGGTIQIASTFTSTGTLEAIEVPLIIAGGAGNSYTIQNNSAGTAGTMEIGGTVTNNGGGATLILGGSNGNGNVVFGIISDNSSSGATAVTKTGAGFWILDGANTYTGQTHVAGGTLEIGDSETAGAGIAAASSVLVDSGATLAVAIISNNTFTNNITDNGTVHSLAGNLGVGSLTFSGVISGTGNLVADQFGTTILSNVNTYQGGTQATGSAILQIGTNGSAGSAGTGTIAVGNFSTLALVNVAGGTLANNITNGISDSGTVSGNETGIVTLSGTITDGAAGTMAVQQIGGGTTILSNSGNTYSGGTTVFSGALQIGTVASGGSVGSGIISIDTGTLSIVSLAGPTPNTLSNEIDPFGSSSVGTVLANSTETNTISGLISNVHGGVLNFTQSGTGTTILTAANTYTGATNVTAGTLQIGDGVTTGASIAGSSSVTVSPAATLAINLADLETFSNSVTDNGTVHSLATGTMQTLSGVISGTGNLVADQFGGTTVLTNTNTYQGGTQIANVSELQLGTASTPGSAGSGTIAVGNAGTLTLVNVSGGVLANAITNGIGGTGTVSFNSTGTVTLSGAITDGATGNVAVAVTGAGTLFLTNPGNTFSNGVAIQSGGGNLQIGTPSTGGSAGSGAITVDQGGTLTIVNIAGPVANVLANDISSTSTGTVMVSSSNPTTLSGQLSDSFGGALALTQAGSGPTIVTGSDPYTGATTVNGGTLQVGDGNSGNLTGTSGVTVNGGAVLALNLASGSTFSPGVALNGTTAVLNAIQSGLNTVSGVISGSGVVNQNGTGITVLSNTGNTYTGATTVNNGILAVNGVLAAGSAVGVNSGGTLEGTGTIGGTVTVNSGGAIAPGSPLTSTPGTLNVGGLVLNSGANSNFRLAQANLVTPGGGINDLVNVTGNLTLGGNLNITQLSGFGTGSYTLYTYSGSESGSFNAINGLSGFTGMIVTGVAGQVSLAVSPGPTMQFWDGPNTTATGSITGGTGTWDNSTTNWTNSSGTSNSSWQGNTAVFSATAGTVTLGAPISAQSLIFGTTGYTIASASNALTLTGAATINVTNAGTTATISAQIAGSAGLNVTGAGTLILTNSANSFSGNDSVSGATVQIGTVGSAAILGGTGSVSISNGGTISIVNHAGTIIAGNTSNGVGGLGTLQFNSANSYTFTGTISDGAAGQIAVTQSGTGTTTLTGSNSYSGATNVQAGTLQLGSTGALGNTSAVTVSSSATLDLNNFVPTVSAQLNLNGTGAGGVGALTNSSGTSSSSVTYSGPVTLQSSSSIGSNAGNIILSNTVSGAAGAGLTKIGSDELLLSGSNTYNGTTTVAGGALIASSNNALGAADGTAATGTTVNAGATLGLTNGVTIGNEALTITGVGANFGSGTVGALSIAGAGGTVAYGGAITLAGNATISPEVNGTMTLTGSINKTGVDLTLGGGTGAAASGTININGAITGNSGSYNSDLIVDSITANLNAANSYIGNTFIRSTSANAVVNANVSSALPNSTDPNINDRTALTMGDGSSSATFTTTLNINSGSTQAVQSLSSSGATGLQAIIDTTSSSLLIVGNNGGAGGNTSFNGTIEGSGTLQKDGTSIQTLTGTNSYTGGTNVLGGTLRAGSTQAFGLFTATTVTGSGILDLNGFSNSIGYLTGNGTVDNTSATPATLSTGMFSANTTFSGVIQNSGGGALSLTKVGNGTQTLSGNNSYTGTTTVSGGTLQIGDGTTTGTSIASSGQVQVGASGTLAIDLSSGSTFSNAINNGGAVNAIASGTNTLSGVISGVSAFNQNGTGITILTNANTYTGTTTVNAGTLLVDGSLQGTGGPAGVLVNNGGTFGGIGTIAPTVTVFSGGTLAPGDISAIGTLTVGNLILNAGSTSDFRLAQAGTVGSGINDLVNVTGNLTLGGTLNITQIAGFGAGSYTLYTYGGSESGTFSNIAGLSGFNGTVVTGVAGQVSVTITVALPAQYWDGSGSPNDGIISGGSGTWDNSTNNWTNASGSTNSTWQGGTAVFNAPGGTVTLGAPISAEGLIFGTTGYTITSPSFALTLAGSSPTISVTNASDVATIAAQITGTAGLTLNGAGTLVLTNSNNSYTGTTTISGATLQIGTSSSAGSTGAGSAISVGNGGTFLVVNGPSSPISVNISNGLGGLGTVNINSANTVTISGILSDGGAGQLALTQSGSGATILTGANTYSGTTTISNGFLQVGAGGASATTGTLGSGTVVNNSLLSFARSDAVTVANTITGTGELDQDGLGTLTLSGTNTYSGPTFVNAGTLQAGSTHAFGINSGVTVIDGAILELAGFSNAIGSLSDGGITSTTAIVQNTSATAATLTTGSDNTNTTFAGVIQNSGGGALSLVKTGTGTFTLSGANTYDGTTTVNAGILNIQNGAALGSTVASAVVNAGATLQLQGGIVTNAKPLTLNGAGAAGQTGALVNVSGNNTFAGPITLGSASTISSDAGQLTLNNAAAISGGGNALTLAGASNGFINDMIDTTVASVTKNGAGTWQLGTAGTLNTYTGPTTVNAGVLQAGSSQAFGNNSAVNLAAAGATLDLNGLNNSIGALNGVAGSIVDNTVEAAATLTTGGLNSNDTFNGVIQNSGSALSLTKVGTGTTILTGNNTYAGATTVNAGTLQVGNGTSGNLTGTSGVTVGSNATLATNLANGATFSPSVNLNGATAAFNAIQSGTNTITSLISGTGVFNQNGTGTTILTAANTYSGATTVNAGFLEVNGSLANSATAVTSLGTLQGIGSLASLVNNGTVAPGSTAGGPGTLTVNGNYTQGSSGNLRIGLVSTSTFGRLAVNGSASLNGSVTAYSVGSFTPVVGNSFQILNANGGVTGTFSSVVDQTHNAGTLVQLQAKYSPMGASLLYVQGAIPIPPTSGGGGGGGGSNSGPNIIPGLGGFTGNGITIAKIIDGDLNDPKLATLLKYLDKLPLGSLPAALDRISPEELSSLTTASTALSDTQVQNIQSRLDALISGISGFTAQGMHLAGNGPEYAGSFSGSGLEGPNGADGKDSKEGPPPYNPRLGTFITGAGEWVSVGNTDSARGYDLVTGGFTLGVDYKLTDNLAVGIDAGYAHTGIDLENGGRSSIDAGNVGLYGTYFTGGFYADGAVTGTYSGYDNRRAGLQGDAYGQTHSGAIDTLFATGYNWHVGGLTLGPTGSFHYNYTQIKDYSERGSLAPMSYPTQGVDSIRTAFGAKATYDWHAGGVLIRPELSLAWQHEYGENTPGVIAQFANGAGNQFTVFGPDYGRDSLLFGAGFAVIWNERFSSYFYYDGEFGRTNYDMSSITGGLRLTF